MEALPEIQINQIEETPLKTALRWNQTGLGPLTKALAAAKKSFDIVKKTAENPLYKDARGRARKYADLTGIITATTEALSDNGLVLIQAPLMDGKLAGMVTLLTHEDGGWIEATITGCPAFQKLKEGGERFDAQTIGIAFTYLARYGEGRLLNIGAEDDDANSIVTKPEEAKSFVPAKPQTFESDLPVKSGSQTETFVYGLPSQEELTAFAKRLKDLKQDSRLMKNYLQSQTGKSWNESSKDNLEKAISSLEAAHKANTIAELLSA